MHQTKKGNQWYFGMKVHAGMDKNSCLIHSVVVTTANLHELTPAAELLHGDEKVVYGDAGYQGIAKRPEMAGKRAGFRVAIRPCTRSALPDTPDGRVQDLIERAKAHIRSKVEHPFRVIKQQFSFQKTQLRGLALLRPHTEHGGATRIASRPMCWKRCLICSRSGDNYLRHPDQGFGVSEHLDLASKISTKWLNMRARVIKKRAQMKVTAKPALPPYCHRSNPVCPESP